ncbi:thiol-disulfide oxidoreductase [Novosphingobium beihaiensis]|uniref:Thiol-disulfide oxidoreductase n=1 Tax=Novosphingobium beihaiensis TaxID=2930389 RepID=A0ABT0BU94_9SPHN|nr:thiol-disulfide oxidoreductase [Novosphingobium beihaiensis]MCJ2188401.1 thiol-disulfide oxidoreductase [Novosphingobium beihaiensis]
MQAAGAIPFFRQPLRITPPGQRALPTFDGLTAFAPFWGAAALFSIAGDPQGLIGREGLFYFALAWAIVVNSAVTILYPRKTWALVSLALVTTILYLVRLPVASNNKTITTAFDLSLLVCAGYLYAKGTLDRSRLYELIRMPARLLLATMYFYGIYHKINTDFLDPTVSCAVGLYKPLAAPFGVEDNLIGRYAAIWATFVIEGIAIVSLFWRKWFAVGLVVALVFHYIIPISAYSWYMDFSSLVFALYMLTMPREASAKVYELTYTWVVMPLRDTFGRIGVIAPAVALLFLATSLVLMLTLAHPGRPALMLLHSIFILIWAVVGGAAMTVMVFAAMHYLPYKGSAPAPAPRWTWIIPVLFFVSCLSPYVGLKTESSINMFSNLRTEGGTTNHLMFSKPPYLFSYQSEVVKVTDSSSPSLRKSAAQGQLHILFAVEEYMRRHPNQWVTYVMNGKTYSHQTAANLPANSASWLERKLLIFKTVDPVSPKVCTH